MIKKRYSVFISSTFEDLQHERQSVQDVVISAGDFPVQMESFPAADEDQFEFIKALIDTCDYYVLIIAGRYGRPAEDGLSYTEKEYRYAVSKGIPVLAMLHGDRGSIPTNKSETDVASIRRLRAFIAEVETSRLRKSWKTSDGLKLAVREALDHAKTTKPGIGWVRGDSIASIEALEELNDVRRENAKFRDAIGSLQVEIALPPIPAAEDEILVDLLPNIDTKRRPALQGSSATVQATWIALFPIFFHNLKWSTSDWNNEFSYYIDDEESCVAIGSAIAGETAPVEAVRCFRISKATLDRLSSYYIEAGLMNPQGSEEVFTDIAQRVARRHSIATRKQQPFPLFRGEVAVTFFDSATKDLSDEIPF